MQKINDFGSIPDGAECLGKFPQLSKESAVLVEAYNNV
jgi:hypothetical protein